MTRTSLAAASLPTLRSDLVEAVLKVGAAGATGAGAAGATKGGGGGMAAPPTGGGGGGGGTAGAPGATGLAKRSLGTDAGSPSGGGGGGGIGSVLMRGVQSSHARLLSQTVNEPSAVFSVLPE